MGLGIQIVGAVKLLIVTLSILLGKYNTRKNRKEETDKVDLSWLTWLATAFVGLLNLCKYTMANYIVWIGLHWKFFGIGVFLLAVSGPVVGAIKKEYPFRSGKMVYAAGANVTGAACSFAFLLFIRSLPGFLTFVEEIDWRWGEILGLIAFALSFMCGYQVRSDQKKNPESYSVKHLHTALGLVHLWFTFAMIAIFGLQLAVYCIFQYHQYEVNYMILVPVVATTVFFIFVARTYLARKYGEISASGAIVGLIILTAVVTFVICFSRITTTTAIVGGIFFGISVFWYHLIHWIKKNIKPEETSWIMYLPIIMIVVVAIVVAIQLLA